MKCLLHLLLLIVSVSGCRTYQYITVNSNQLQPNNVNEFIAENDSIQITYSFRGKNFPVNVRLMNKLDKPIVIDWKRTSLIVNDQALSFFMEDKLTQGTAVTARSVSQRVGGVVYTDFTAVTSIPPDGELVPPKSYIVRTSQSVINEFIELPPNQKPGFVTTDYKMPGGFGERVKMVSFGKDNSPVLIRSYLSMLVDNNGKQQIVQHEHTFYISSLIRTDKSPVLTGWKDAYQSKVTGSN